MLNEMEGDVESSKISDVLAMAYYQQACILYEERVEASIEQNVDGSMSKVIDDCLDQNNEVDNEKDANNLVDQFKVSFKIFLLSGICDIKSDIIVLTMTRETSFI